MRALMLLWVVLAGFVRAGGLSFEATLREFHLSPDAKEVAAEFPFENKTDRPVKIARVESSCATCLKAETEGGKMIYQPGEKGRIRLVFDTGNFSGTVDKMAAIWQDKDPDAKPSVLLTVRTHIPVLVEMSQKTVVWKPGETDARKVVIRMKHTKPIRILRCTCSSAEFLVELGTVKDGAEYEVRIQPKEGLAKAIGIIRIETDCDIDRHRVQQMFAQVRTPISGGGGGK